MKSINILHLYPDEMNTYGDRGNMLVLQRRAEWHGLEPVIHYHHPGQQLPGKIDLVFGGGGQDSAQSAIQQDILRIGARLRQLNEQGVPMLTICGTYQLFGHRFITHEGEEIQGIGIFNLETRATKKRLIGNVIAENEQFGTLYGFENHSGQTYLAPGQPALAIVSQGNGNNDRSRQDGARRVNALGSYMHGPLLPRNPALADWLIATAYHTAYGHDHTLAPIDDAYAELARVSARTRAY